MDEERGGTAEYHLHDQNELPARYTKQRGGKRRKTTMAKREKREQESLALDEIQLKADVEPIAREERYKISSEDSSSSSVDEDYEVDSIASSIENALTYVRE